ncbi:MAG: translation elongation factor Ts [Proteiniphilum sp.]|jgi:elongation factor Ts|nr:translation elongation factor Ts [Proteiniphilum sp.]NCD14191.1 elongation factor Ts [Bacteroidia bacterium]HHT35232.1 elongation factor Ts [Bacteroidales bacterium]MDD2726326.1 translation elongation factor Ts [Proteiniphilum sp.]MDD3332171.1 translation elongation factor Ts [Proteiniphilum sp.]
MAVTMADIQHLRKMTGAGMMDCKNALNEANGDFDKAMEIIRKKGQAVAAKREDREASEGCVLAATDGNFAAVVALQCETDFVAKNDEFVALTRQILDAAILHKPETLDDLLALELPNGTVSQLITDKIGATGEKMQLGFYEHLTAPCVTSYIHMGNKLATIVGFNKVVADEQVARDVAMQVAAMNPIAVTPEGIPAEVKEKELEIAREKAREAGKPENLLDRIAEGSLQKFYKESTLLQQEYVKDGKKTIEQFLKENDKELAVTGFKRVTLNV